MTPSTSDARRRGKKPPASGPRAAQAAEGRGFRTRTAGAGRAATGAAGAESFRIGNCERVASRTGCGGAGGYGTPARSGAASSGGKSRTGRSVTPELWTAASAADATTGERESFRASSSTPLKRSAAEISRAAEAGEATSEGSAGRPAARSRGSGGSPTTEGVRSAVFSIGSLASARRYSTTAAPSWRRSPLRRIVSFRIRRPATNVPFEEFRSLRTAVPFPNVTSA